MIEAVAVTFDIDWAPDWAILECAALCQTRGVPATFFVTHDSPALGALRGLPQVELGIHPNFLPRSSHGHDESSVLNHCLRLVPEARAMRTHSLYQSSRLFAMVGDAFPQIQTDVSLFLPLHQRLQPTDLYFGRANRRLTRLPYFWEDDDAAVRPSWRWNQPALEGALQIYAFHPIHVVMNTADLPAYETLKRQLGTRALAEIQRDDVAAMANAGEGTASFLNRVLVSRPASAFRTVSAITDAFRKAS